MYGLTQGTGGPWKPHKTAGQAWTVARFDADGRPTLLSKRMPVLTSVAARRLAQDVNAAIARAAAISGSL